MVSFIVSSFTWWVSEGLGHFCEEAGIDMLLVIVVIGKAKQKVCLLLVFGSYLNQQVLKLCEAAS